MTAVMLVDLNMPKSSSSTYTSLPATSLNLQYVVQCVFDLPFAFASGGRRLTGQCNDRNFTPTWFSVIMGTGAVSMLFSNFPYDRSAAGLKTLSAIFFFLNLSLFVLSTMLSIARYLLFPKTWSMMDLHHPVQSMYVATYPMGAATLLNVCVNLFFTEYGFGGKTFLYIIWGFWWADVMLSCICCGGMIYIESTAQTHILESLTVAFALPFVPPTVISSTGGALAPAMAPLVPAHALLTATLAAVLLAIGLSLILMAMSVYLRRLILHGHPPGLAVISTILPVGSLAQLGVSVLYLSQCFRALLPVAGSASPLLGSKAAGETLYVVCTGVAFVLWVMATAWLVVGLLGVQAEVRRRAVSFKLTHWGLIFPVGVYATLTINLYRQLDGGFFRVYGAVVAAATLVLWLFVAGCTISMLPGGVIFDVPCLKHVDIRRRRVFGRGDVEAVKDGQEKALGTAMVQVVGGDERLE